MTVFPWSRRFLRLSSKQCVVAGVQADRRLVENVDHADQAAADLGRQADPLALAAGQRRCAAVERQVIETAAQQEPEPAADFLERLGRDHLPRLVELERFEVGERFRDAQRADFRQAQRQPVFPPPHNGRCST